MKSFFLFFLLISNSVFVHAQYYTFAHFTEPYSEFTDGTLMNFDSICNWDVAPPLVSIGFPMPYFNTSFSSLRVDQSFLLSDNLSTVAGEEILAQLFIFSAGFNLNPSAANSAVRFKTTGPQGSRLFQLQFKDLTIQNDSIGNDRCNFQLHLYEENGRIEFRAGAFQISQNDGYFTNENGVTSGILLYDEANGTIFPGSVFLMDAANAPNPLLSPNIDTVPTVVGHPTEGRVYQFNRIILGLETTEENNLVEIYPNPFKDNITVKCSNIEYCKLTVFDISGRQLLNLPITTTEQTFFLQELILGAYLLQRSGKPAPFYFKLLKK